ncbi:hypothetical protein N1031_09725 [Herbiconiux moechotypicola]|uniref:DNA-3-methyladenine glycosylase II n=1 Tax=Herbiconiux moechotypicola TaxID=637393 RepID=A0ABP5QFS5_9MICO|nr:hypothetical protein [Herbiconiux moechotypicola]MCS5730039.1 hypothetical protein [Herbiconiux moechotypicola]
MTDTRELAAAAPRGSFTIEPRGPFSLRSSIRFLEGFGPASFGGADDDTGRLDLAFALEGSWRTIGASLDQSPDGTVRGRLFAGKPLTRPELSAARAQVERILSLDVDGSGFEAVGELDPVVGELQLRYPGLRPVCFWSWYEAAAWSIIGQRTRMTQAAEVKRRMAEELGVGVEINGVTHWAFPSPSVLSGLSGFPGLTGAKVERLRSLGEAARRGAFDSASLRGMPRDEAFALLQELPGIGPFSAELILLRGAGDPDHAPVGMQRFAEAVEFAYRLPHRPGAEELTDLSESWAPYRTWVTLLLRVEFDAHQKRVADAR